MTPQKRAELTTQPAAHGLSVLLTRDYDAILLQLAQLAQFERLMLQIAACNPAAAGMVGETRSEQKRFTDCRGSSRPLEVLDIPSILNRVNRALHDALDAKRPVNPSLIPAATAAFVTILCQEG